MCFEKYLNTHGLYHSLLGTRPLAFNRLDRFPLSQLVACSKLTVINCLQLGEPVAPILVMCIVTIQYFEPSVLLSCLLLKGRELTLVGGQITCHYPICFPLVCRPWLLLVNIIQ